MWRSTHLLLNLMEYFYQCGEGIFRGVGCRKVGANGWGGFYSKIAAAVRADALTVLRKFTF